MKFFQKRKEEILPCYTKFDYTRALLNVSYLLDEVEKPKDKIDILEFMMKSIRQQIQSESILSYIYPGKFLQQKNFNIILPIELLTDDGLIEPAKETHTTIDFSKTVTVSTPKEAKKYARAIINVNSRGFTYKKNNHFAIYYKYLDICVITNGYHHTAAAILDNKGTIVASHEYDTELIFPYVSINNKAEIELINGEVFLSNTDIRFALLYTFAKMKWQIENNS